MTNPSENSSFGNNGRKVWKPERDAKSMSAIHTHCSMYSQLPTAGPPKVLTQL